MRAWWCWKELSIGSESNPSSSHVRWVNIFFHVRLSQRRRGGKIGIAAGCSGSTSGNERGTSVSAGSEGGTSLLRGNAAGKLTFFFRIRDNYSTDRRSRPRFIWLGRINRKSITVIGWQILFFCIAVFNRLFFLLENLLVGIKRWEAAYPIWIHFSTTQELISCLTTSGGFFLWKICLIASSSEDNGLVFKILSHTFWPQFCAIRFFDSCFLFRGFLFANVIALNCPKSFLVCFLPTAVNLNATT